MSDRVVINAEPQKEVKVSYPPSPIDGTYAYSSSGIPVKINLTYQDRRDNNYEVFATFTAREYWYKFLWDYGPTYIKEIRYQIFNTKTGKTYTTNFQTIFDGSSFYGHGRTRYASYTISKSFFCIYSIRQRLGCHWYHCFLGLLVQKCLLLPQTRSLAVIT